MTLWPISMFSRIWATNRPAVPTNQAGGNSENSSTAREPSSSLRWVSMTLRMYAASLSPRFSMNSARIASSSAPMFSMSPGERWSMGLVGFFCRTVMVTPSARLRVVGVEVVDRAGAGGGVDAGLDLDPVALVGGGDLAGAEVTD